MANVSRYPQARPDHARQGPWSTRIFAGTAGLLLLIGLLGRPGLMVAADDSMVGFEGEAIQDVIEYQRMFDVAADEAILQIQDIPRASRIEARLSVLYPDTFSGLWIDHEPYRIVAAFKGDIPELRSKDVPVNELHATFESISAGYSLDELMVAEAIVASKLQTDERKFGSSINVKANRVDVDVLPGDASAATEAADDVTVDAMTGARAATGTDIIHVSIVDDLGAPAAEIYGGIGGVENGWSGCPSGFSIRRTTTGTKGIVTAGHCSNTLRYNGTTLPHNGQWFESDADVQWHTTPTFTPVPKIVWTDSQSTRWITADREAIGPYTVGEPVCKYGPVGGYKCGTVDSKAYRPPWVPNAVNTFVRAKSCSANMVSTNDSGGPAFYGGNAFGIISGYDTASCGFRTLVFTPTSRMLYHFNLALLVH